MLFNEITSANPDCIANWNSYRACPPETFMICPVSILARLLAKNRIVLTRITNEKTSHMMPFALLYAAIFEISITLRESKMNYNVTICII